MMPYVPPIVAPPSVLRIDWKTLARLTFRRNKPSNLDACPASYSLRRFYSVTDKAKLVWFWGQNQQTIAVILMLKSLNRSYRFWDPNRKIIDISFEAQPRNPHSSSPCAQYRSHTMSSDLPITQSPSTRPVLDHPQSSTPGLLILPQRHVAPATCTPRDKQTRFFTWNKNEGKTTEMSRIRI
jgi:hypothetical protein